MENTPHLSLADLHREIELLMEYGSPADERERLKAVVERYAADAIAMQVFRSFYSYLPEAQDDGIIELRRIASRQGVFLLWAKTLLDDYLYLADREKAEFLGVLREGIWDDEILKFFGWRDRQDFLKRVADPEGVAEHLPLNESPDHCPVCGTAEGEVHTVGCPLEVCPWCGGQLIHCQCRFSETGRTAFTSEAHLEEFQALLEKKGRIPFSAKEQRPALQPR